MSVTLNEAGLRTFFSNPQGVVSRIIEGKAQDLTIVAQREVEAIMHRTIIDPDTIGYSLSVGEDGVQAVVGVHDRGPFTDYLDHKALEPKEGTESWMLRSMLEAFSG